MRCAIAFAVVVVTAAACGQPESITCDNPPTGVTWDNKVADFTGKHCTSCHASGVTGMRRQGAPDDVNYDTYEAAVAKAREGAEHVEQGDMPPSRGPTGPSLSKDDRCILRGWVAAGTPR